MRPKPLFRREGVVVVLLACFLIFGSRNLTEATPIGDHFMDDFSSTVLNSQWSWIDEEPALWSLTANPGYMRLITQEGAGANFLVQPLPGGDFTIETYFLANPQANFQNAGIVLYLDDGNHLSLIRAKCSVCGIGDGNGIFFDHISGGGFVNPNYGMAFPPDNETYLKIVKQGNIYTGFVSANGVEWTLVGSHTLTFTPQYMGLRASNNGGGDPINADFDYFEYFAYPINTWGDEFNSEDLDSQWNWIEEEPTLWSLTANPGYLRLSTMSGAGANFLVQPMPTGDFVVETHVFAEPLYNFQNAGLILYLADGSHLSLIRAKCSFCGVGDGNGIFFDHVSGGEFVNPNYGMAFSPDNEAYLRIVKHGNVYTGFVSANGVDWTLVGSHTPAFTPQYMGLRASNNGGGDPINADFDYF